MLIGIDASRANKKYKTGTEWYSYHVIKCLAHLDSKNQYILYTDKPLVGGISDLTSQNCDGEHCGIGVEYDKKGFQIIKSPFNNFRVKVLKWPFTYFWTQGRLSLEMLFKSPDVLFIPSHALPLIHPQNSVVTVHDVGFEVEKELYCDKSLKNNSKFGLLELMVRIFTLGKYGANSLDYLHWSTDYTLKKSKKIITISNFSKNEIKKYFDSNSDKIKVIPNGYNKNLYKKEENQQKTNAVLEKYGISSPYILYVGRIEKKKNISNLIKAFAQIQENHNIKEKLVLVGNASFGADEVRYLIDQLDLEDKVIMPGWVEEDDMPYFFNGTTVFVFPSNYEGFGIPILQAMACGVPVVASDVSSIPEVAGDACCFFDPSNVDDMAKQIESIILDNDFRGELVGRGYERILKYSWENTARQILELFQNL